MFPASARPRSRKSGPTSNRDGTVSALLRPLARVSSETPTAETSGYAPLAWPVAAAFCLVLGIALAGAGLPLWSSAVCAGVLLFVGLTLGLRLALLTLLFIPLGFGRLELWEARPQPLAPLIGTTQTFSGSSDGTYLTLDEPAGAKVVLSPKGVVGAGRVTLRGDVVAASRKRNPGGFDYAAFLARRGVGAQVYVDEVTSFEPAGVTFKTRLQRGVVAGLSPTQAALQEAMTLGIRDNLRDLRDVFAAAGLAHVLALSGLHIGVLIAALGFLLRPLGVVRYPLMVAFVIAFAALVGATPSVLRATTMAVAVLLSLWLGSGRLEPWPALSLAALLALLWNPSGLFDLSFQLSYLAVIGILVFALPTLRLLHASSLPWWHPKALLLGSLVVSLGAQAPLLPLLAHTFGTVPVFGPVVNIVALPLATVLVPLGFLAGVLGTVSLPLAALLNHLTAPLASALIWAANESASWPSLEWGEIAPVGFAYYGVGACALALVSLGKLRLWRGLLVVAAALSASTLTPAPYGNAELVFLDVGQGDSTLIRLPHRTEILVDGGGTPFSDFDVGENTVVPALRALGVDELELVIASHTDTDHIEGLASVLRDMPVGELIIGYPSAASGAFTALINAAKVRGVPVTEVRRGEVLQVGDARLDILNPPMQPFEASNDNSVAFVLNALGSKALFLGDLPSKIEDTLAVPDVNIMMVAHHGSRFSTSDALLNAAKPEQAVLSYGRNNYGHPNPDVLARLRAHGAAVFATQQRGAVRLPLGTLAK